MERKKESFLLYLSDEKIIKRLTDQQAGQWIRYVFAHERDGSEPPEDGDAFVLMAFDATAMHLEADRRKYNAMCEKNRRNISERWSKTDTKDTTVYERIPPYTKDTTVYERIRDDTNYTDNDNDIDNDNDYETEPDQIRSDTEVTAEGLAGRADLSGNEIQRIPTLEEVMQYSQSNGYPLDVANKFYEYNEKRNWIMPDGKPVQNWKLLLVDWVKNEKPTKKTHEKPKDNTVNFQQRTKSYADLMTYGNW